MQTLKKKISKSFLLALSPGTLLQSNADLMINQGFLDKDKIFMFLSAKTIWDEEWVRIEFLYKDRICVSYLDNILANTIKIVST